jgi:hypothetical protein
MIQQSAFPVPCPMVPSIPVGSSQLSFGQPPMLICEPPMLICESWGGVYQAAGGDIRLLLVANRINNSGKLALDEGAEFDFQGFSSVRLYPYPEDVIVLGNANGAGWTLGDSARLAQYP